MILVTGPTGFVGRHVVRALVAHGHSVRCLVRTPSRAKVIEGTGVEIVHGDVTEPPSLAAAVEGAEAVVHLAGIIREKGPFTFHRVNCQGARNLVAAAKEAGVKRFVHVSAIGASDEPSLPYLYSRWLGEQEVIGSPLLFTVLRLSLVFGEGDKFINLLAAQVKAFPVVPIPGDGKSRLQPIAVEEAAECIVKAYEDQGMAGRTVELGGPEQMTYGKIIDLIAETLGKRIVKTHVPISVMRPLVSVMGALLPRSPVTPDELKMLSIDNTAELDSVERAFGFTPRSPKGNIDYIKRISFLDAVKINLGFMPLHIRDH